MKYFLIFMMFFLTNKANADVFSWSAQAGQSLALINYQNAVISNNSLHGNGEDTTSVITEDIVMPEQHYISDLFVYFSKNKSESHVIVKVYDTFTERLINEYTFHETGLLTFKNDGDNSARVFLKLEIYGTDIMVHSFGVSTTKSVITIQNNIIISPSVLQGCDVPATITFPLEETARVYLYIYNNAGDIVDELVSGQVLPIGAYTYSWYPKNLKEFGEYYYVWVKLENLRSDPVEVSRQIYIIPEGNNGL